MTMASNLIPTERTELELRRQLAAAEQSAGHYANLNSGGKWGHGRGNFSDNLNEARGRVRVLREVLQTLTGGH